MKYKKDDKTIKYKLFVKRIKEFNVGGESLCNGCKNGKNRQII